MPLSRRRFLRGVSLTGAAVRVGLPPLAAMFNSNGTAYAAAAKNPVAGPIEGEGIPPYRNPSGSAIKLTAAVLPDVYRRGPHRYRGQPFAVGSKCHR